MPFTLSDLRTPKQTINVELIPLDAPPPDPTAFHQFEPYLKVTVDYDKGGRNIFYGHEERRGYYLRASRVELDRSRGYLCEQFTIGKPQGRKIFLEAAKAFSAKKLAALAATITNHPEYEALKARVLDMTASKMAA